MVESRCGLLCSECGYKEKMNCKGCVNIDRPFWASDGNCPIKTCVEEKILNHCGECGDIPCDLLNGFAYDKEQGDDGKRIDTCRLWAQSK